MPLKAEPWVWIDPLANLPPAMEAMTAAPLAFAEAAALANGIKTDTEEVVVETAVEREVMPVEVDVESVDIREFEVTNPVDREVTPLVTVLKPTEVEVDSEVTLVFVVLRPVESDVTPLVAVLRPIEVEVESEVTPLLVVLRPVESEVTPLLVVL